MSKNTRSKTHHKDDMNGRRKTSLRSEPEDQDEVNWEKKSLKPTKSFQKLFHLNKGILRKVRSTKYESSVGGEVTGLGIAKDSFINLGNLIYDEEDRLVDRDNNNARSVAKIKQIVRARQEFKRHRKEEIGIDMNDPQSRKALRKMKLPKFPKKQKVRKFLLDCLRTNQSFARFTNKQFELIVDALKPKKVGQDVTLMVQGDIGGSFYIVQKGKLTVSEQKKDEKQSNVDTKMGTFGKKDSFGEVSLLYGTRRHITVKTDSICFLWKLDHMSFKKIVAHGEDEEADFDLIFSQLKFMPMLAEAGITADEEQLKFLARNVHHVKAKKNQIVIRKDDPGGDMMYFLKQGRVRCTRAHGDSESVEYMSGDYFAEGTLFYRYMYEKMVQHRKGKSAQLKHDRNMWKRAANVYTMTDSEFFIIDFECFKSLCESNNNKFLEVISHNYGVRILKTSKFINDMKKMYRDYLLENLEVLEYEPGEVIIKKGETEKVIFLVVEGQVEMHDQAIKLHLKRKQRHKVKIPTLSVGASFGESYFFNSKPYKFDVVSIKKTKIFAMTYTIFSEVFGQKLKMKDLKKVGDPAIDEAEPVEKRSTFNIGGVNFATFASIEKVMQSSDDVRKSSKILQKISANFEVDKRTSMIRRTRGSVKVKPQDEEEVIGQQIESKMKKMEQRMSVRRASVRRENKIKPKSDVAAPFKQLTDRFKILGPVGMGTFGVVKIVKSKTKQNANQKFALKVLDIKKIVKLGQQDSVIRERNILKNLKHPFILKYINSYKTKDQLFIMTEVLIGGEIFEIIQQHRKDGDYMPDDHAIFYAACMVETFTYLGKKNIVYRDLKPENVMIDAMGYTRLIDFGFAKKCEFKTFTRCGTAEYFAPELLAQKGYNRSVDLWGIGVLLYECMSGMSPFFHDNYLDMLNMILNEDPNVEGFPPMAADFISKTLTKEPNNRLGMSLDNKKELKQHPMFQGISWKKLRNKEIKPPFIPNRKLKIRSEAELKLRLNLDEEGDEFDVELKERDYKGWYDEF